MLLIMNFGLPIHVLMRLCKGGATSEGISNLVPSSKNPNEITVFNLLLLLKKMRDSGLARLLEDGTKLKLPHFY